MTANKKPFAFTVQINNKDGSPYRKYTKETLQMLFAISPSAANFELIIVIEGIVFMAIRSFYMMTHRESEYGKFLENGRESTFYSATQKIYTLGIVDKKLYKKLDTFRTLRNEIAHDLFQIKSVFTKKSPKFKDESHDQSLKKLFNTGLEVFAELGEVVTPGRPTQMEYVKRFTGKSSVFLTRSGEQEGSCLLKGIELL